MKEFLYGIVAIIAEIHTYLMQLNDDYEFYFNDKELHFIIIGLLGMAMVITIYPIFKQLAKKKHYLTLTWIYVFTLIIVITFAIEIGQKVSNTGNMDFGDIMFGVAGFIAMYAVYASIVTIIKLIGKLIKIISENNKAKVTANVRTISKNMEDDDEYEDEDYYEDNEK